MRSSLMNISWWKILGVLVLLVILLLSTIDKAQAQLSNSSMRAMLNAARNNDFSWLGQLKPNEHILDGYLRYHQLRYALPDVSAQEILVFIHKNADSPISEWLRNRAIDAYGKSGRYRDLLAVSDGIPTTTSRQCYYYQALLQTNAKQAIINARQLWLHADSQPSACDPLFDQLLTTQAIDKTDIWQRLLLAWQNNNSSLSHYLASLLTTPTWQSRVELLTQLPNHFSRVNQLPFKSIPSASEFIHAVYRRWSQQEAMAALNHWLRYHNQYPLERNQRDQIEVMLAKANLLNPDINQSWLKQVIIANQASDLMVALIRNALNEQDWPTVINWIRRLPAPIQNKAQWQYWLARGLKETNHPSQAHRAFVNAARQRDFYGFIAADHLQRSYVLNNHSPLIKSSFSLISQIPAIQRIKALYQIDEPGLAFSEWHFLLEHRQHANQAALAAYAIKQQWYSLAIQATLQGKFNDALAWRFPRAFHSQFAYWSQQSGIPSSLLMAIARRESSMNRYAQSPVGALGLMQIMPATARYIIHRQNNHNFNANELFDVNNNIGIGSYYFSYLLNRYNDNHVLAIAAYNAGPNRVDRWLANNDNLPFDLFIELIPFTETRNYVQAILAYNVIYQYLAQPQKTNLLILSHQEKQARYGATLLH